MGMFSFIPSKLVANGEIKVKTPRVLQCLVVKTFNLQAMPQLTDRSKLPSIVDPVIRDTMDLKHLYQVH